MAKDFITNFRGDFSPERQVYIKNEPLTPTEIFGGHQLDDDFENDYGMMKKSLSMGDIASLREELMKFDFQEREDAYERYRTSKAPQSISKTKFVSMAEAIYHFQKDTPGRFRSTPMLFQPQGPPKRCGLTKPQSPKLRCKGRSRPLHILSLKEKEELEVEEIKNYKIKANPVPKSVLLGSNLPEVPKKSATVPQPFNLTEMPKKIVNISPEQMKFKAAPVPKKILEKPHMLFKPLILPTIPQSPKLSYKRSHSEEPLDKKLPTLLRQLSEEKNMIFHSTTGDKPKKLGPVKPVPFSFEKRDEELKRRKEESIRRQIEEERKLASQFKAQPVPGAVKKRMQSVTIKSSSSTSSENKENHFKFEARPAVVLNKEPFKPTLQKHYTNKTVPFQLTTEKRAAEREKFDKHLKEKEEEQERYRQMREKEVREIEEKTVAELRQKLIHHAKPVPNLKTFVPEKSTLPITIPGTPNFVRRLKKH